MPCTETSSRLNPSTLFFKLDRKATSIGSGEQLRYFEYSECTRKHQPLNYTIIEGTTWLPRRQFHSRNGGEKESKAGGTVADFSYYISQNSRGSKLKKSPIGEGR